MVGFHSTNSQPPWKGTRSGLKPTEFNPKHFKKQNSPVAIVRGGRVSNPVPGRLGPKASRAPEFAENRRDWSAKPLPEVDMPERLKEAMRTGFEFERFWREICSNSEASGGLKRESGACVVIMAAGSGLGKRKEVERFLGRRGG